MKVLLEWFEGRSGFFAWLGRVYASTRGCGGTNCLFLAAIATAFVLQALSGFFLWMQYSPSAQTAWESVYYLQNHVAGGWLLRAIHHYSAHVLLAVLILYILQQIYVRSCRPPRELVFWSAVGLALCALAAILTGDLLCWDQNGYAATKTRVGFLTFIPWVGEYLFRIAIGGVGPGLGHLTLTHFFAWHIGLFAAGFFLLLVIHALLMRRVEAAAMNSLSPEPRYFRAWLPAAACLIISVIVLGAACRHGFQPPEAGVELLSPADVDPANQYAAARPEWFLVGLYELSHLPGLRERPFLSIFIIPGVVLGIILAMPFLARSKAGHLFNLLFTTLALIGVIVLSCYSLAKDRADTEHQRAIAVERQIAGRAGKLIRRLGIPPTGALSLLRNDPWVEGRRLFAMHCASCHSHVSFPMNDSGLAERSTVRNFHDVPSASPSAPNLWNFAGRDWLKGLLDPKRIGGPDYFGNTKFRSGKMADFVKETLADLEADEHAALEKVVRALSAEAGLPEQSALEAQETAFIAEGRQLLAREFGCTDCHKFHDKGALGTAPDLTGYGSREWLTGIIRDPGHRRFYGENNDRMPAYAPSNADAQHTLSAHQIELLVDWLRGEWYEEENSNK